MRTWSRGTTVIRRSSEIGEGTTEVQLMIIARELGSTRSVDGRDA